jgi:5-methylcytosine-specific restriction enzyme A
MAPRRFHSGALWQKTRALKLRLQPLCEKCLEQGTLTIATIAHHKIDVVDAPHLATTMENLTSLCREHHEHIHCRHPGYSNEFGVDGMPVDPRHPCYAPRPSIVRPTPRRR